MRVAVVDGAGRVLLVRHPEPGSASADTWALPGRTMERGESSRAVLERLLAELEVTATAPDRPVWRRTEDVSRGGELVRQDEDVHLVLAEDERPSRDGELLCPLPELPLLAGMSPEPLAVTAVPRPVGARRPVRSRPPRFEVSRPVDAPPRTGPLWK